MKRRWTIQRAGMTLVLVTTIGAIVGILAMSMLELGYHARILSVRSVQGISARTAADAGVADAIFWMQQKLINPNEFSWSDAPFPRTIAGTLPGATNAQYSYTISILEARRRYQIDSTGTCAGRSKTVHTILSVGSRWRGIGVEEDLTVFTNATFGGDIELHTNSTENNAIVLKAGVNITGDVVCGPGGNPDGVVDTKASTVITGDTYAAADPLVFPPVTAPTGLVPGPVITGSMVLPQGRYSYASLMLPNAAVVEIAPDTLHTPPWPTIISVDTAMILLNGAEVRVQAGAKLDLYIGISLESKEGTGFTNENPSSQYLRIYGLPTCTQISLKAKDNTYAAVYAPSANVDLYNGGSFYGAIIANSFEMKNSGYFYFDQNARSVIIDDVAAIFEIERWSED